MSLHVSETGAPSASSIIFLHGSGTSSWMWTAQVADLSDFHCLTIDLPGHGKSNHIPWVSLADTADQVANIIKTRATSGRAYGVGLSLGAYVVLELLSRTPERIERAVVSGVTAGPLPDSRLMRLQVQLMSYVLKVRWVVKQQAKMLHIPDDALDAYMQSARAMSRASFVRIFDEISAFRLPEALRQVDVPLLVTAGGEEAQLVLDAVTKIQRVMPNAEGRLAPGLHHGWNGENPDLFSAMLRAWFTDAPLPDALQPPAPALPGAEQA